MIVIYIYFQASGRGGCSGDSAYSIVYWAPKDCPLRNEPKTMHERELNEVRQYLQNSSECRRKRLLEYFDPKSAKPGDDPKLCCDVCATSVQAISTSSDLNDSFNESALASVLDLEDDKRMDNPSN